MAKISIAPKTCHTCGVVKRECDFYRNRNGKGGYEASCRVCSKKRKEMAFGMPLSPEERHKVCLVVLGQQGCGFKSREEVLAIRRRKGDVI